MTSAGDAAAVISKRAAAPPLRDVRSIQQSLDTLAATAPAVSRSRIAGARAVVERLVIRLPCPQRGGQG